MDTRITHCLIRFGFGRKGLEPLPSDRQVWLRQQVYGRDPTPVAGLPAAADAFRAIEADREMPVPEGQPPRARAMYQSEASGLLMNAVNTPTPFRERLVWFWMNHFTVSVRGGGVGPMIGDFVRAAVRPHVTGRFEDMLIAVMRHPAMLLYLDNAGSMGPSSPVGFRQHKGLNENLARECMELHTVSPAAGYTQADVTEFAKVITGWSVERKQEPVGYRFRPMIHEPGPKTVMGRQFEEGEQGGIDALLFLANHPATYRHLATKLARHFIADDPSPAVVRKLETVLRETRGDLAAVSLALIALPEAWQPLTKLRTPQEFVIATVRAADLPPDKQPDLVGTVGGLGQALWNAPFPIGWPDKATEWAGPESLLRRIDWAFGYAGRANTLDPDAVAEASLGPLLSDATRDQMRHAGARRDALTLLFTSPEFQRR